MKKLSILGVLLLMAFTTFSQSFEGIINWSMKMDITDPATKARMEEAQKKMSDPATQAKMKEMQAKMNDPQMKAMMDANPQMKAQMEAAMKVMAGGDINAMIPKGMMVKLKNDNSLVTMDGGMMDKSQILYLKDKDQSIHIDNTNKTYSIMNSKSSTNTNEPQTKVTKTSETKKILTYTCTKYIVESTSPNGKTVQQLFWTTKDITVDMKNLSKHNAGSGHRFFYDNIEGVPLQIEMSMPEGKMTMEATEIKKESLSTSLFQIPAGYKEVKGGF
ncbi:MAG TPA: DUF4412 domain-containing protein [Cyclobacteriaceae bacterium]